MWHRGYAGGLITLALLIAALTSFAADDGQDDEAMAVAMVTYTAMAEDDAQCFSDRFLTRVSRETDLPLHNELTTIELGNEEIFDFPFVVLSGSEELSLNDSQREELEAYLEQGGFILASARCADPQWAQDFSALMEELIGEESLDALAMDHPVFQTIYEIEHVQVADPSYWEERTEAVVQGWGRDDRLQVLFSPAGLNVSHVMGPDCRCCEASEVGNASLIKANVLGYALTR